MILFMDKKKFMVTDNAVELCKKLGKQGVSGFVNAFLRRFSREEVDAALPKGEEGESVRLSYPLYAYRFLKAEYGARAETLAAARSSGLCVRFVRDEEKYLGSPHVETPFPHAYIFPNFVRDEGFDDGAYTFQSVGSIAICGVIEKCDRLLDSCAAPGGKSVLLSEKCGQVTAFELHEHRVGLIQSYCQRMGVKNVIAMQKDSSIFDPMYAEKFDGVLCDVPCSGFGTVSENPDIKLFRKEEDFLSLREAQSKILAACARYVKWGGAVYYSTCSLFERENDGIVGEFLKNNPDFVAEPIDSPLAHETKKYGLQFLPDKAFGAGFYIAKLKRNE
jgi:16S rRNA (cytosine967-C5)-methyltransferase